MMNEQILQIVYVSSSTELLEESQLMSLLAEIREKNQRNNITGMLLYKDGDFMQAIEGPEHILVPLYEEIAEDDRHSQIIELIRQVKTKRDFGGWTMGYKQLTEKSEHLEGFNRFFDEDVIINDESGNEALELMKMFRI